MFWERNNMGRKKKIRTGDFPIVNEWVNNTWPEKAKEAIAQYVPDYKNSFIFRTAETVITIKAPIEGSYQIILNYCISKKCFLVYNAAIQNCIRQSEKIHIRLGKSVLDSLSQPIVHDSISSVFQEIRKNGRGQVEHVLIVDADAIEKFCKSYKELIVPDTNLIPRMKTCLYAEAGGEIQKIQSTYH